MTSGKPDAPRGRFISFEGGEGSGKSTQARRLAARLRELGLNVVETREPGGTPGGEIIREAILSGRIAELGTFAEALLMNAARDDHLNEVIRPAIAAGDWVITDRFADSTRAYQGRLGGLDSQLVSAMEQAVVGKTWPDLTIVLDIDPAVGLARARRVTAEQGGGRDRFESAEMEDHVKLREAFLAIARGEPERCVVIDASGDAEAIAAAVWDTVCRRLLGDGQGAGGTS